jgi:hypothetical protein
LKAPENQTGREQNLIPAGVYSVGPISIVDLQFRLKILEQVILKRRVPKKGIAEIRQSRAGLRRGANGVDRDLRAERRLNVEITPALAERQGRLRDQHIVGYCTRRPERIRHLEERGHDVIAVVLIGGDKAVFDQERWPIAPSLRGSPRTRGGHVRRSPHNDFQL